MSVRLWSLHPRYLDRQGLLACWREALLAQKVLQGGTRGYRHHPQLARFRAQPDPLAAIAGYLAGLRAEAGRRGYRFDAGRIAAQAGKDRIPVPRGQLHYEWEHLKGKLARRDPGRLDSLLGVAMPDIHPLFILVDGDIEPWEKTV
jgi:hypothetical protein